MATFSKISLEQMENMLSKGNSKTEKIFTNRHRKLSTKGE